MTEGDAPNDLYKLAASFVQFTSRHVFLTGKAGTGKTTFLKDIVENSMKNTIVVAPTGVAAINAGGVTMHSFFQLPFGPFIPISTADADGDRVFNRATLFRKLRLGSNKKKLINELELLIIDEISMVRADMLDAMDAILRYVRKKPAEPFGGVQLLMIGDLFQLPPVVPETDWRILQAYYDSPYFFSAKALTDEGLVCIELEKVFRQRDNAFITLLNKVRTNTAGIDDIEKLNECYSGVSLKKKNVITLTTHNQKAHGINSTNLRQLKAGTFTFEAIIDGEFQEKSYPAEEVLELKEGAQVMFTKNDREDPRRYYNGKIGVVSAIAGDDIFVSCPEDESEIMVAQEEWKSIKYELNEESQEIEERELGTFRQYPLRLAWAITIHKSQGLTFEKAIIDAGASFSSGQVYVALSRLTSLEGLTLSSRITSDSIRTDARIVEFMLAQPSNYRDFQATLKKETATFIQKTLINSFD
ncbi:MAG: AAA family ATPase, partial [Cyclobacteriaceae bacterium]|nr:AAA family ATPase [Cyclobacteriaceae bacterium HetDA_MAG_MS6]